MPVVEQLAIDLRHITTTFIVISHQCCCCSASSGESNHGCKVEDAWDHRGVFLIGSGECIVGGSSAERGRKV